VPGTLAGRLAGADEDRFVGRRLVGSDGAPARAVLIRD